MGPIAHGRANVPLLPFGRARRRASLHRGPAGLVSGAHPACRHWVASPFTACWIGANTHCCSWKCCSRAIHEGDPGSVPCKAKWSTLEALLSDVAIVAAQSVRVPTAVVGNDGPRYLHLCSTDPNMAGDLRELQAIYTLRIPRWWLASTRVVVRPTSRNPTAGAKDGRPPRCPPRKAPIHVFGTSGLFWDFIGIMENRMETTIIMYWTYMGRIRDLRRYSPRQSGRSQAVMVAKSSRPGSRTTCTRPRRSCLQSSMNRHAGWTEGTTGGHGHLTDQIPQPG